MSVPVTGVIWVSDEEELGVRCMSWMANVFVLSAGTFLYYSVKLLALRAIH